MERPRAEAKNREQRIIQTDMTEEVYTAWTIVYRVVGITGATETLLGEEESIGDACELIDVYECHYDWVGIIEVPLENH